ncbi:30S ribosomal protein S3Ae [Halodesulfurarchaeum formicicum]|uniref:Small ribosomal subunit protein eS1 n=1 Tax=Halodesulfurarchaeum formicicum TaxID=1873524 RepID=A0A1D8S4Y7_9EURY|nr:30S ribosomal protein S3ae [Halodesulfurarchaeum formicicum]AOW80421.1 30S ribosomal protein S3Ae [Halodesulfurarchaeum formicicum]APE95759.1 30S ribosomal protein S3Ae [Halodesulfurarchaeum formicicum]
MSERSVSKRSQEKRWYTVLAPEQFDRAELGTTPAIEPEQVIDRTIQTTLGDVVEGGENNVKLTFQVNDVGSDSAYTEFSRYELTRDYKRSLVRRGSSKVKAVLTLRTADDHRISVQPVAFTTKVADRSQKEAIRAKMTELVTEAAKERTFEEFLDSIIQGHLSSAIYNEAKTIYPLRRVEVEKAVLDAKPAEVEAEEETAAVDE